MEDLSNLLKHAAEHGILVYAQDGRLKARAADGALDEAWKRRIGAAKDALLDHLAEQGPRIDSEQALDAHEAHWRELWAETAALELPFDRPRPGEGAQWAQWQAVSAVSAAQVRACAQRLGIAAQAVVLGAYAAVLGRWSGQGGATVAVRAGSLLVDRDCDRRTGWDRAVDSALAVRAVFAFPGEACAVGAQDYLRHCASAIDAALAHRWLPLRAVPALAGVPGPLFQAGFAWGGACGRQGAASDAAELELGSVEEEDALRWQWRFDAHRFDPQTVQRLAESLDVLLAALCSAQDHAVSALPLLGAQDRALIDSWRAPAQAPAFEGGVHEAFIAQAQRDPRALALVCGERRLDYGQVDRLSDRFAARLLAAGLAPEQAVGLCLGRSADWVIAVLGILKAGGAYMPMDPQHPPERLRYLVQDSGASIIATETSRLPALQGIAPILLPVDEEGADIAAEAAAIGRDWPPARAGQTAYVIYTSGSTGLPKGVRLSHAGADNLRRGTLGRFGLGPSKRVAQFASISFDVSTWDWILALTSGAALFVCEQAQRESPQALEAFLLEHRITHAVLPPALLAHLEPERAYALECLVSGGEALDPSVAARWAGRWPLHNGYGPSETTVVVTSVRIEPGQAITIGRPFDHVGIRVLDGAGQPTPVGVPGELLIEGIAVGLGYIGRPELTAERFLGELADPAQPADLARRAYRTGDRVRVLGDGRIEFLGRLDEQVKIRGFRIELGEIGAALHRLDGVREACAIVHGEGADKRLVAYVAPSAWPLAESEAALALRLRSALERELPEYMLPAGYVFLEALPVTVSGKVDRRGLPDPERAVQPGAGYVAPRDEAEARLCAIWAELLKLERVGIHDRFFAIGGDSILLIQAVARANQAGLAMTARHLHEHQTVASLRAVLGATAGTAPPERAPAEGEAPLLPIQREFLTADPADRHHFNQSMLLRAPADADEAFVQAAVAALYAQHDALRLRFSQNAGGAWRSVHAPAATPAAIQALAAASCATHDAAGGAFAPGEIDAICAGYQAGMDLEQGPLLRAVLLRDAGGAHLFVCLHHLIVDGVSWRILLEDLDSLLRQHRQGASLALPPRSSAYQDWGRRLLAYAQGPALERERGFWLAQYAQPAAALPCRRDAPAAASQASTGYVQFELPAEQTRELVQRAGQAYRCGVHELLLAAVYSGLRAWSGAPVQRLTLEGHGREALFDDIDLGRTIGWFTTSYPLTLAAESEDPGALLRAVKEQVRAVPGNGIGHGLLLHLRGDAQLAEAAAAAAPQVLFNYLGQFGDAFAANAAAAEGFALAEGAGDANVGPARVRSHALGFNAVVSGGTCKLVLDYSRTQHDPVSMQALVDRVGEALRAICAHCLAVGEGGFTPSDFPLAQAGQAELDQWQARYRIQRLYPATPMQKGMLFHTLMRPDAYLTQTWPVFRGALDADRLRQAWRAVSEKYDILRTAFVGEIDRLHQVVVERAEMDWRTQDWRALDPRQREQAFARYRQADRAEAFDPARAPLQRVSLLRLEDERHCMLWTNHHMLLDGWCLPLVYADLMRAYAALGAGRAPDLGAAAPYQDYIAWLIAQDVPKALAYWRERLRATVLPTPLLPVASAADADADAAADADATGDTAPVRLRDWSLDAADTRRLLAFAQAHEVTPFTLVQLAWACLLGERSGLREVVYGATVSGRPAEVPGIETMVGLFINTIPVKAELDGEDDAAAAAQRLQQAFREADRHSYVPLAQIQKQCLPKGRGRLFDSLVIFENYPLGAVADSDALSGLSVESVGADQETNYAVTVSATLSERLELRLACRAQDVPEALAQALAERLGELLRALPDNPRIGALTGPARGSALQSALPAGLESAPTLAAPGPGPAAALPAGSVLAQIQAAVVRDPDAVAAALGERSLCYGELWRRSDGLAAQLRARGAGAERAIGLLAEPSPEFLIAALAILKAGAAYLPLDPSYPQARLQAMLDDARPELLLAGQAYAAHAALAGVDVLVLEAALDAAAGPQAAGAGLPDPDLDSIAYVIYTSGSTGRPKGVQVRHAGLANLAARMVELLGLRPQDKVLQFTPTSFDVSVQEIFSTLAAGARLQFLPAAHPRIGSRLVDFLRNEAITVATLPPTVLTTAEPLDLPALRMLVTGAEPISERTVALWGQGRGFCYQYGPTEASVTVTAKQCRAGEGTPGIGRCLGNTQAWLADEAGRPVAAGEVGELLLGGIGLARGYLRDPAATAARFVPDPFSGQPGARLYRSGDLARLRADGDLEFVGRNDDQVKLRGYRIELGDVESALLGHPLVRHAVAVVAADPGEEARLAAYVQVDDPGADGLVETLRAHMQGAVAAYMRPSAIVPLARLPIGVNGKIDKRLLPPAFAASESAPPGSEDPAAQDAAARVAAIFAEAIGVASVGLDEDFFDAGGDSLLAVKAATRINERLAVDINVALIFEAPTARALAARLPADDAEAVARLMREIESMSDEEALRLLGADSA